LTTLALLERRKGDGKAKGLEKGRGRRRKGAGEGKGPENDKTTPG